MHVASAVEPEVPVPKIATPTTPIHVGVDTVVRVGPVRDYVLPTHNAVPAMSTDRSRQGAADRSVYTRVIPERPRVAARVIVVADLGFSR